MAIEQAGAPHAPRVMIVTGGAGFIGCNYIHHVLAADPGVVVHNVDALTYAGNARSLAEIATRHAARYRFHHLDILDGAAIRTLIARESVDTIVHFAAESHVDRSIDAPDTFIRTNVNGTAALLTAARSEWKDRRDVRFHHVSTDEVYGSLGPTGAFTETTPYDPSSPYSASKAASDHLVRAWHRTFGLPVTVSNCSNNYGPFQFPEKLIPLIIMNALRGKPLPVYGDGKHVRDWLYVEDHCRAIDLVLRRGASGSTYNVGGNSERTNIDIVTTICAILDRLRPRADGAPYRSQITYVADRPGHDRRYAIDASRIRADLGWTPAETLETGLDKTVRWYLDHHAWIEDVTSGRYRGERLGAGDR